MDVLETVVSIFNHLPDRFLDDFKGWHDHINVKGGINGVGCLCWVGRIGSSGDWSFRH
jgi:hypothetical protein